MVTVEIVKKDLLDLVGKKLSNEEIEEALFLTKVEANISGDKIECELNPDRPDMFSVEGIARAVKGFLGFETGAPIYKTRKSKIELKSEKVKSRPFIACAALEGIKLTDELVASLMQMQEKLHATVGRNRKKVAIGVHDLGKVKSPFTYKEVLPGKIKFKPLGMHKELNLKEILEKHPKGKEFAFCLKGCKKYPVIVDKSHAVLSFPPIINGELTKVTEKTKSLLIEVTGSDERAVNLALNIVLCNIAERSGTIEKVKIGKKFYPDIEPEQKKITVEETDRLLGLGLKEKQIAGILERMRYTAVKFKGGMIDLLIPAYRGDILHNVDIIEDVAIGYGYNNITPELPKIATVGGLDEKEKFSSLARESLIGLGFQEVLTFILTNKENQFKKMNLPESSTAEIANPVSSEFNCCRQWLLPNLLKVMAANKHRDYPQRIFECGDCVIMDAKADTGTRTIRKIAAALSYDFANLTEIKSIIESFAKNIGYSLIIRPYSHKSFIDSRCGEIILNGNSCGFFGEIHPQVLENWSLEKPVIAFEIDLEKVM